MRYWYVLTFFVLSFMAPNAAQAQEIVREPVCFQIRNTQNFTMYGTIGTNYYTNADGVKARHRSNYRLGAAGSKDHNGYPDDRAEFCSYGPFFNGRKLELNIKTLWPVFSCMTRLDQGEILLKAKRKDDDSGYDYWAECFE